ncbi:MAG: tRNA pseudouridine(38-40) synthase TruA [Armatimonadota bacterium]|nr:tRNA pseudouridine(38-40) synthase TruA [Armatimonadota bacterium]MDR5702385.1 tRNA pseudouridine(38-40) synthase TruA [Armatimonadota bacterium]
MRHIKLILEYDGTHYKGWQRQRSTPTIQETLERAIASLTGEPSRVTGAGRTDAGVHALGQVATFRTRSRIPVTKVPEALNSLLPLDIRVLWAEEVDEGFHPRYHARSRVYTYVILNRPTPSALLRHYAYYFPVPLDTYAMDQGIRSLIGRHEFDAYRALGSNPKTTWCTVFRAHVHKWRDFVLITMEADRFLRHMVRMITGTLIRVGTAKLLPEAMGEFLRRKDNQLTGPVVPPYGLYLVRVHY